MITCHGRPSSAVASAGQSAPGRPGTASSSGQPISSIAHVNAGPQTRRNRTRPRRTGSRASSDPPGPLSASTSLVCASSGEAESAHARCHAHVMNGEGDAERACRPSQAAGPHARASESDIRITPTRELTPGYSARRTSPPSAPSPITSGRPSTPTLLVDRSGVMTSGSCKRHAVLNVLRQRLIIRGNTLALEQRDMCGIAGIVYRDRDRTVSESLVRRMCTALRQRGPDDEGLHVAGAVGLGMRRLSIIDVSGGKQPIFNEDGSKVIVFNGEIYNYRELRRGLLERGHTVRSSGDTETVLHLYEDHGADCVSSLRGMFACAIWDEAAETPFLARHRFGVKPFRV